MHSRKRSPIFIDYWGASWYYNHNNCSPIEGEIMSVQYSEIEELLRSRADLHARLNLMPYDGTPEIKKRGDSSEIMLSWSITQKDALLHFWIASILCPAFAP